MRTYGIIFLIMATMATQSQAAGVGIFGSYWDPSDVGSETGAGITLRLNAGQNLLMDLRGSYFSFNRQDLVAGAGNTTKLEVIPLEISIITRLSPAPDFVPYVGAGIGYYTAEGEFTVGNQKSDLDVDSEIGYSLSAGVDIKINRTFNLFAEAKYVWVTFDKARIPETASLPASGTDFEIKMNGMLVNLGLVMRW